MIKKISIRDFKSYKQAELKLAPLTVLAGANASGKSNFLEAIRFLNWLAQGQKLSALQHHVNENDRVVRGRIPDLFRRGNSKFGLGCSLETQSGFNTLEIEIGLRDDNELHIEQETVYNPKSEGYNNLYRTTGPTEGSNTQISVEYNNFARGGKKPQIPCTDQMGIFLQLESPARFSDGHAKATRIIPEVSKKFEEHLAGILFLDPVPQKMRDYSFLSEKSLSGNGSNLSAVLYHLWNDTESQSQNKTILLDFIGSLPEQQITDIEFLKGPRGEVMIQLTETFGGKQSKCDASLLSDGTLRVLALAAALLSAKPGSMVIIEEVDNGIHPSRAARLLQSINKVAQEKQLVILISSHNPALLDALPDEAIPSVTFCFRNPDNGWSELIALEDLPKYPELISRGTLGDLLTKGIIDHFVKRAPDAVAEKQKALQWLETLN